MHLSPIPLLPLTTAPGDPDWQGASWHHEGAGVHYAWQKEGSGTELRPKCPQSQLWHSPSCKPQTSQLVSRWPSPDPNPRCPVPRLRHTVNRHTTSLPREPIL